MSDHRDINNNNVIIIERHPIFDTHGLIILLKPIIDILLFSIGWSFCELIPLVQFLTVQLMLETLYIGLHLLFHMYRIAEPHSFNMEDRRILPNNSTEMWYIYLISIGTSISLANFTSILYICSTLLLTVGLFCEERLVSYKAINFLTWFISIVLQVAVITNHLLIVWLMIVVPFSFLMVTSLYKNFNIL